LEAVVLPACVALTRSLEALDRETAASDAMPVWLDSFAAAYGLVSSRFRSTVQEATKALGPGLMPLLLDHWTLIGNMQAVLAARKQGETLSSPAPCSNSDLQRLRHLDSLFLPAARNGYVPVYGFHSCTEDGPWLFPEAGLLVPASASVELTVSGPAPRWLREPVEVEVLIESDPRPVSRFVAQPARIAKVSIPLGARSPHPSVLVRLKAVSGGHPGPLRAALCRDTAFRACRLHSVLTERSNSEIDVIHGLRTAIAG
jgi:hypothetical protein